MTLPPNPPVAAQQHKLAPIDDFAPGGPAKQNPNMKEARPHCNVPTGPMASCCLDIVPEYSAKGLATIPPGGIDYMDCSERYLTELRRSGFSFPTIIENTVNIPPSAFKEQFAESLSGQGPRAGINLAKDEAKDLRNSFSMRVQRWLQAQGALSICRSKERTEDIPDLFMSALMHLSPMQLFHNTIGLIQPGSFEMCQPEDRHHWTPIDQENTYPLPAPRDIHPVVRKALLDWGRDLGSFKDFLLRNPDRIDHYKLDLETIDAEVEAQTAKWEAEAKKTAAKKAAAKKAVAAKKAKQATLAAAPAKGKEADRRSAGEQPLSQPRNQSRKRKSDEEDAMGSSKKQRTLTPMDHNNHAPEFVPESPPANYPVQQPLSQPQENRQSRKRSSDEDVMDSSKKQKTLASVDYNDEATQFVAALSPSSYHGTPEDNHGLGDFNIMTGTMEVEDDSRFNYNPHIPQYHGAPSPASAYNGQGSHFVDTHQQYGGLVVDSAATTSYDSGYDSGFSPDTPDISDEFIVHDLNRTHHQSFAILQQPMANGNMVNDPVHHYSNVEMPHTDTIGGQGDGWNGGGLQLSTPGVAPNVNWGLLNEPVQDCFDESMQTRDQELSFGAGMELDFVMEFDGWTPSNSGWTSRRKTLIEPFRMEKGGQWRTGISAEYRYSAEYRFR